MTLSFKMQIVPIINILYYDCKYHRNDEFSRKNEGGNPLDSDLVLNKIEFLINPSFSHLFGLFCILPAHLIDVNPRFNDQNSLILHSQSVTNLQLGQ